MPVGDGRVVLRDVRLGDRELADNLVGDLRLSKDGFVLRDITSSFAGGLLRVQGAYRYNDPSRSYFALQLRGADAGRLTAFGPQGKEMISGPIDLTLRGAGHFGGWSGSGSAVLTRGKVFGVEVAEWRVPIGFRIDPTQPRVELTVREVAGAGGQRPGAARRAACTGRTRCVSKATCASSTRGCGVLSGLGGDVSSFASGRVTGRVDFTGADMTSINDLNAIISAKMTDAQALQLPVMKLLVPYLIPGKGATTFQTGEVSAQLSRGVLRVRELKLESPLVILLMQGNVTVQQARLDLDVLARTSPLGANPVAVRLLLRQIPPVGPVPVPLLVCATDLLAERTVYLRVTGTVKTPVVQVDPLRTLSDEAVRFFLGRAIAPLPALP